MKKTFGTIASVVAFSAILFLMLFLNDWGRSAPNDVVQIFWAFNLVVWPIIAYKIVTWPFNE